MQAVELSLVSDPGLDPCRLGWATWVNKLHPEVLGLPRRTNFPTFPRPYYSAGRLLVYKASVSCHHLPSDSGRSSTKCSTWLVSSGTSAFGPSFSFARAFLQFQGGGFNHPNRLHPLQPPSQRTEGTLPRMMCVLVIRASPRYGFESIQINMFGESL